MTSKNYLSIDSIWNTFDVKSQEDFVIRFVTKGKFHQNVPDEIKTDYLIVEHLLFFSYYNYSFIDEAFGKATRIFEASIDLRIHQLGIEKKKGFESLDSKIKKLEKYSSNELKEQWLYTKEVRNIFAHHKAGRLMGITLIKAFTYLVNMINSVFLTNDKIKSLESNLEILKNKASHLKNGLFIMDYQNSRILINSLIPYNATINDDKSFWVFHPVYAKQKITEIHHFPEPFMLDIKDVDLGENGLSARVISTNEKVNISKTTDPDNIELFRQHISQFNEINIDLRQRYILKLENDIKHEISDFIYNYHWS